jgi:hypothetical protein
MDSGHCCFDGETPHSHLFDIHTALFHIKLLLAQSSTTLLQALLMGVSSIILDLNKVGTSDPLNFSSDGGLPLITDIKDVEQCLLKYMGLDIDINSLEKSQKDFYLYKYLPGKLDGLNGKRVFEMLRKVMNC